MRPFIVIGDRVTCPKTGHGTTVIVTGDLTMIADGAPVVRLVPAPPHWSDNGR